MSLTVRIWLCPASFMSVALFIRNKMGALGIGRQGGHVLRFLKKNIVLKIFVGTSLSIVADECRDPYTLRQAK